jgi:hypothetical protein
MTETTRDGVTLQLVRGDIAAPEDIEAVVDAAHAQLVPDGGVAGALHRAAGHGLLKEARMALVCMANDTKGLQRQVRRDIWATDPSNQRLRVFGKRDMQTLSRAISRWVKNQSSTS